MSHLYITDKISINKLKDNTVNLAFAHLHGYSLRNIIMDILKKEIFIYHDYLELVISGYEEAYDYKLVVEIKEVLSKLIEETFNVLNNKS